MFRYGVIYAIVNPKTQEFCYVGETLDFKTRPGNHMRLFRSGKHTIWELQRLYGHLIGDGYEDFTWIELQKADESHSPEEI